MFLYKVLVRLKLRVGYGCKCWRRFGLVVKLNCRVVDFIIVWEVDGWIGGVFVVVVGDI